jgi:lipoprotein-anchoring transpeptidase ErfK/SrfK
MHAGTEALTRGDVVDARARFSEALAAGLPPAETSEVRAHLGRLADQTIFSSAIAPQDPCVVAYVVQPGETLAKIAKEYALTSDILARINELPNKNVIREGQRLKVLRGPFTAIVHSGTFDMEVYLGTIMVKHFRVGLGTDGSTPTGKWKVQNKLKNPTYYPPRGGAILAADDPKNPLGERWIGLTGVEGDAVGQQRYGIHGTIEPESIGKYMSLGCVRLLNSDVELLFEMLVEEDSTVIIR